MKEAWEVQIWRYGNKNEKSVSFPCHVSLSHWCHATLSGSQVKILCKNDVSKCQVSSVEELNQAKAKKVLIVLMIPSWKCDISLARILCLQNSFWTAFVESLFIQFFSQLYNVVPGLKQPIRRDAIPVSLVLACYWCRARTTSPRGSPGGIYVSNLVRIGWEIRLEGPKNCFFGVPPYFNPPLPP